MKDWSHKLSDSFYGCLLTEEFRRKKINLLLIFACSCRVLMLPHSVRAAVNIETLPGGSCEGIEGRWGMEGKLGTVVFTLE